MNVAQSIEWRPRHNPWLITFAVMAATFMEVLDTSVANVALPHIAGNLAVTSEESTWVLTSYLLANGIVLPLTGWLSARFGRKRLLVFCIFIFTASSALCGLAPNLGLLVFARVLQGIGGGVLQPISQAVLLETFPPAKRGMAMSVWAMGVVVAPILGPTLGGWITDNYSWRWIFYVNLPVGAVAAMMAHAYVEDPPFLQRNTRAKMDYIGFGLLVLWLATLQIILDKGQQADWFAAVWLRCFAAVCVVSFAAFIRWEIRNPQPIVDLRVFANRNFAVGVGLVTMLGAVLYGTTVTLPLFMQTLMGYSALQSGMALSPRGIGAFVMSMIVGRIVAKISNRFLMTCGFILLAVSAFALGRIDLSTDVASIVWPSVLNGLAISLIFIPLTSTTMGLLKREQIASAAGLFNLMRNTGGGIGIALITTLLSRFSQANQALMVQHLSPFNPIYQQQLAQSEGALRVVTDAVTAGRQSLMAMHNTLLTQASLESFLQNFRLFGIMCFLCVPVVWLFRKVEMPASGRGTGAH